MSLGLLVFLGIVPLLILFFFLIILRWTARTSMILAFASVLVLATTVWEVPANKIAGASFIGFETAFSILYIVFGALLLLNMLKESGGLGVIRNSISGVTDDRRIQVILILWIFGAFLEGAAGYGSTGAVIGSMLVGLGFPAMASALMVMIFQSTSVTFGAAGAPISIGLSSGLGDGKLADVNSALQVDTWGPFLLEMTGKIALVHGIVGTLIPLFMVVLLTGFFGQSVREGFKAWKFALFGGLSLTVPYVLSGVFLGPEFPSLLGGLIGIVIAVIAAKKGWFMPKDTVWRFKDKSEWKEEWSGILEIESEKIASFSAFRSWLPYIITAALLFIVNAPFLPISSWLGKTDIAVNHIFGSELGTDFGLLTSPGFIFLIVSILTYWMHDMEWTSFKSALKESVKTIGSAGAALIFAVPMVQVFLHSDGGAAGFESMPETLASGLTILSGNMWAFIAPVVGALGAFLAGSNVFSNLMFSHFQLNMAVSSQLQPSWVLALQAIGAGAGNMFSVHNVITAAAAVGLVGREGEIIRKVILPGFYYILLTGAIGFVILMGIGLNIGTFVVIAIYAAVIVAIWMNNRNKWTPMDNKQRKMNN
ncbi:L-lactate permease [Lentibacillus halophilus]|uniref:L-lactate permease n=1 Tax=Lentibacillus halophilus TaxID=295065 RepID=A0ABP3J2Z0_9BACI